MKASTQLNEISIFLVVIKEWLGKSSLRFQSHIRSLIVDLEYRSGASQWESLLWLQSLLTWSFWSLDYILWLQVSYHCRHFYFFSRMWHEVSSLGRSFDASFKWSLNFVKLFAYYLSIIMSKIDHSIEIMAISLLNPRISVISPHTQNTNN